MKIESFQRYFDEENAIVVCRNAEERNNVLMFLHHRGYHLNEANQRYIFEGEENHIYLHPGISNYSGDVACYGSIPSNRQKIYYDDIFPLLDVDESVTEPDATEFNDGINILLFG